MFHPCIVSAIQQCLQNDGLSSKLEIAMSSGMVLYIKGDSFIPGQKVTLLILRQAGETDTTSLSLIYTALFVCLGRTGRKR